MFVPGAFQLALGALAAQPRIAEGFRSGEGLGWNEQNEDVFVGCERFFRPGYIANLVPSWIPALEGVEDKLRSGARVADIGCGHGASTVLLAQAYPASTFVGSDYHDGSIEEARKRAADAGVGDRVSFEVATAQTLRRDRVRPGRDVRLPARHGRPGRGGPARARGARAGRHLADRRAVRQRRRRPRT